MGGARGVIALVIGAGTLGADRGARDHLNRAFVETFEGDAVAGGRPPGPGRAAELLLRDAFGGAACARPLAVGRDLRLAPVGERYGAPILVAPQDDPPTIFRDVAVGFRALPAR